MDPREFFVARDALRHLLINDDLISIRHPVHALTFSHREEADVRKRSGRKLDCKVFEPASPSFSMPASAISDQNPYSRAIAILKKKVH